MSRQIMFWAPEYPPQLYEGLTRSVSPNDVLLATSLLRSGETLQWWKGYADCRICGERLGTTDKGLFGFVWPEKAEHYVEVHGVWVPGLDDLMLAARSYRGPRVVDMAQRIEDERRHV